MSEDCGRTDCGMCVRQDVDVLGDEVYLVTYVGEYIVQTRMAPEADMPMVALMMVMEPEFPAYFTMVGFLGDENASAADSKLLVEEDQFLRWYQRHNDDEGVRDAHQLVVAAVKDGSLDLSTPITQEAFKAESMALGRKFGMLKD